MFQVYADYLREARESLYLTLDRLKLEPAGHPLNSQIGDAVEEVGSSLFYEAYITAEISLLRPLIRIRYSKLVGL